MPISAVRCRRRGRLGRRARRLVRRRLADRLRYVGDEDRYGEGQKQTKRRAPATLSILLGVDLDVSTKFASRPRITASSSMLT